VSLCLCVCSRAPVFIYNIPLVRRECECEILHVHLGALRDQEQLWENCFLKMFVRRRLWEDADPLQRRKRPNVRARRTRLGPNPGCHGASWCLPVRARSLEPSATKCSKRDGACEMGRRAYAPPNAPGGARATSPRVCVRWLPGAPVRAAPYAHAEARSARPFAGTRTLWGALGGAGGRKTAQGATCETQTPSPGV